MAKKMYDVLVLSQLDLSMESKVWNQSDPCSKHSCSSLCNLAILVQEHLGIIQGSSRSSFEWHCWLNESLAVASSVGDFVQRSG